MTAKINASILCLMLCVFAFSGYNIVSYKQNYHESSGFVPESTVMSSTTNATVNKDITDLKIEKITDSTTTTTSDVIRETTRHITTYICTTQVITSTNQNKEFNTTKTSTIPQTTAALTASLEPYCLTSFDKELIKLVNVERNKAGLASLTVSSDICSIAAIRAEEASSLWSHTRPMGGKCDSLFDEYNIEWTLVGENLAHSSSYNAEKIVGTWMNSESHRTNILNDSFTICGIATYTGNDGNIYIAQIFSK